MKRRPNKSQPTVAARRARRLRSSRANFERVMQELTTASAPRHTVDPFVERLRQCPEAFRAGEIIGKIFDTLKYGADDCDGGERYLPPAGVVLPLF
jgi:hypothetical protein